MGASTLSVPYPRVWSRKPRRALPHPLPSCPHFQYPILGSGHGNPPFSAPFVSFWAAFSTLSSGLVTETLAGHAVGVVSPTFQYPILGSGHGNHEHGKFKKGNPGLSVPYPRVWSRKRGRGLVDEARRRAFQYPILGSGHGNLAPPCVVLAMA